MDQVIQNQQVISQYVRRDASNFVNVKQGIARVPQFEKMSITPFILLYVYPYANETFDESIPLDILALTMICLKYEQKDKEIEQLDNEYLHISALVRLADCSVYFFY